jgi:hypothetical protein
MGQTIFTLCAIALVFTIAGTNGITFYEHGDQMKNFLETNLGISNLSFTISNVGVN